MSTNHIRSKWAAVGAAVAVSLGAGGIGISQATTSSGERPVYLPIEPCRLADTRAEFQVGPRTAPLGPNETYTLSGQGAVGNCSLPAGTTALSLNVTAINATEPTFVALFPAGAALPVASHLNPLPGQGPVPNAVNVDLSAGGEFSIYNLQGNVDIFIDVVGVYDDHNHDDRYYPKSEIDIALAPLQPPNPVAVTTSASEFNYATTALGTWQNVISVAITVPDGYTAQLRADFGAESSCYGSGIGDCSIRIQANGTDLAPAEGTSNAFDSTEVGTATLTAWEETSIVRSALLPPGTYTVQVAAFLQGVTNIGFRLDELMLFTEAHLIPA
jgi:hypothetical protein